MITKINILINGETFGPDLSESINNYVNNLEISERQILKEILCKICNNLEKKREHTS